MSLDEAEKTVINVKGVPKRAWDAARQHAMRANDSMGTWLGEAIDYRIAQDSGSVKTANPSMTPDQITARIAAVASLQQSAAALKMARVRGPGNAALKVAVASMEQAIAYNEAPQVRLISGKDRADSGKAVVTWIDAAVIQGDGQTERQ